MKTAITILVSIFYTLFSFGQDGMREIKITKEWKINPNATFEMNAKNESFTINFWDKDYVKIDFILKTSNKDYNISNLINDLSINVENSNKKLSLTTSLKIENSQSLWDWLFKSNKKNKDYSTGNSIYLPRKLASIILNTNYCNLGIGGEFPVNIPMTLTTNYGFISMVSCIGAISINASYTDIEIIEAQNANINTNYGNLSLNHIETLSINSNYSDIKIASCPFVKSLRSNYGNIKFITAGIVNLVSSYTDIKLYKLSNSIDATLTYSDIQIKEIAKNISSISIIGNYSDIDLNINAENPLNFSLKNINSNISIKNSQINITEKQEIGNTTTNTAKTINAISTSPIIKIIVNQSDLTIN